MFSFLNSSYHILDQLSSLKLADQLARPPAGGFSLWLQGQLIRLLLVLLLTFQVCRSYALPAGRRFGYSHHQGQTISLDQYTDPRSLHQLGRLLFSFHAHGAERDQGSAECVAKVNCTTYTRQLIPGPTVIRRHTRIEPSQESCVSSP